MFKAFTTGPFTGRHIAVILVAFFTVVIAVNIYMARSAITTFGGEVVENSYVASQHYNTWLDEAAKEKALGWQAKAKRDADGRVSVTLAGAPAEAVLAGDVADHLHVHVDPAVGAGVAGRADDHRGAPPEHLLLHRHQPLPGRRPRQRHAHEARGRGDVLRQAPRRRPHRGLSRVPRPRPRSDGTHAKTRFFQAAPAEEGEVTGRYSGGSGAPVPSTQPDKSDTEMLDPILYNLFPNQSYWAGYGPNLVYRWTPIDVDNTVMEIIRLKRVTCDGDLVGQGTTTRNRRTIHQPISLNCGLQQSNKTRILLSHNGLFRHVLRIFNNVTAKIVKVFLFNLRERRNSEELHFHTLSFKRSNLYFTFVAMQHICLTQIVKHIVLNGNTRCQSIFQKNIPENPLISQLELNWANHRLSQTNHSILPVIENMSQLGLLLTGRQLAIAQTLLGRNDVLHVVVRRAREPA